MSSYSGPLRKAIDNNDWPNVVLLTTRAAKGVQGLCFFREKYVFLGMLSP